MGTLVVELRVNRFFFRVGAKSVRSTHYACRLGNLLHYDVCCKYCICCEQVAYCTEPHFYYLGMMCYISPPQNNAHQSTPKLFFIIAQRRTFYQIFVIRLQIDHSCSTRKPSLTHKRDININIHMVWSIFKANTKLFFVTSQKKCLNQRFHDPPPGVASGTNFLDSGFVRSYIFPVTLEISILFCKTL